MSKAQNLKKIFLRYKNLNNSIWSIADVVLYPIFMIGATPVFINKLGIDQYGIWMLVNSIIAGLGFVNVNLGDALIKHISKYRELNKFKRINSVISTTITIYLILFVFLIIIGILLSYAIVKLGFFKISSSFENVLLYSIQITTITLCIKLSEQVVFSIFKGFERYDIASQLSIVTKFFIVGVNVIFALTGVSLVFILLYSACTYFSILFFEFIFVKNYYKLKLRIGIEKLIANEVLSFGIFSWFQVILNTIASQADKLIIAALGGPTILAFYSIASMVASQIYGLFIAASSWIFPFISRKWEINEEITEPVNKMQMLILGFGIISMICFFYIKDYFIIIWLGREKFLQIDEYLIVLLSANVVYLLSIVPHFALMGTNNIRLTTIIQLLSIITRLPLMYFAYKFVGNIGLVYGNILSGIIIIPLLYSWIIYKKIFLFDTKQLLVQYVTVAIVSFELIFVNNFTPYVFTLIVIKLIYDNFKFKTYKVLSLN